MLYMVECRFTDPAREPAWNDWYSGKRLDELLAVPGFRASQRFVASTRPGRHYLAVHSIDSLEVFQRAEYKAMGGGAFQGYQDCITDWVRQFFEGVDIAPAVRRGEVLIVTDAPPGELAGAGVTLTWVRSAGRDDRGGARGYAVVEAALGERLARDRRLAFDVYVPMIERRSGTAPSPR